MGYIATGLTPQSSAQMTAQQRQAQAKAQAQAQAKAKAQAQAQAKAKAAQAQAAKVRAQQQAAAQKAAATARANAQKAAAAKKPPAKAPAKPTTTTKPAPPRQVATTKGPAVITPGSVVMTAQGPAIQTSKGTALITKVGPAVATNVRPTVATNVRPLVPKPKPTIVGPSRIVPGQAGRGGDASHVRITDIPDDIFDDGDLLDAASSRSDAAMLSRGGSEVSPRPGASLYDADSDSVRELDEAIARDVPASPTDEAPTVVVKKPLNPLLLAGAALGALFLMNR